MDFVNRIVASKHLRVLKKAKEVDAGSLDEAKRNLIAGGESIIPKVLDLLRYGAARPHASEVLGALLSNESLPTYVEALSSENATIVGAVVEILSANSGYDATKLLDYLSFEGGLGARLELILLARGNSIAPRRLLPLLSEGSSEKRTLIFRILEKHEEKPPLPETIRLLKHKDWWIRAHLLKLLARFPADQVTKPVVELLQDRNKNVRLEAVQALGAVDARAAIPDLCGALRDQDLKVHLAAIDVLVTMGDVAAVPHLVDVLKDNSEYARRGAVEVLNEVATTEAIRDLVQALHDEDWWVRVRAADALGALGGERVVGAVVELLGSDDVFLRRYAVEILFTVPNEGAVEPLIQALADDDWWVRERAIDALATIGDRRAVEPLIDLMGRDPEAAHLCAKARGEFGDERAIDPLCELAGSGNPELAREARSALATIARREISAEEQARIRAVIGDLGAHRGDQRLRPLEVRGKRSSHPEFDRPKASQSSVSRRQWVARSGAIRPETEFRSPLPTGDDSPATMHASGDQLEQEQQPQQQRQPTPAPAGATPPGAAAYMELHPDTMIFDRYRVIRKIGSGGFGTVYLAEDTDVKDELILKILSPHISVDETMLRRFVHELKYTRRITHKNVIRIYDFLRFDTVYAISMEYMPGRDLAALLHTEKRLDLVRGLHIAEQICEGLDAAHSEGIIHRDIKPPNILVGADDTVKIVDFGLAAMMKHVGSRLTRSDILIGTPHYMAPEQITGDEVDARTDIYSLGVMMYEMFAGRQPFTGENAVNILFQHLEGDTPQLRSVAEDISEEVERVVMSAMARNRDDRPKDASEFLEMIRALGNQERAA